MTQSNIQWHNRIDRDFRRFDVVAYRNPRARRETPLMIVGRQPTNPIFLLVKAVLDQDVRFAPDMVRENHVRHLRPFIRWEELPSASVFFFWKARHEFDPT